MSKITILLPHGEPNNAKSKLAPRLRSLEGRRVGFIDNDMWRSMHILVEEIQKVITSDYGVLETEVLLSNPMQGSVPKEYKDRLQSFSGRVDAVISGLGN